MATYLARPCPKCNGYLGIVLREPGRNTPLQAINGHCVQCGHRLAWILIRLEGRQDLLITRGGRDMLDPQKTLEREALLKRIRELDAEITHHDRNLREREARLPIEEQLRLKLRRFIEVKISELAEKVQVETRCPGKSKTLLNFSALRCAVSANNPLKIYEAKRFDDVMHQGGRT